MTPHLNTLDLVVLVGYFAVTMAIGLASWRKSRSVEGFTAANRTLPGWLTGLSILGTYVSSISFLALPGKAFAANWNPFVFSLSLPFAAWVAVKWFVPFYRKEARISAYEHLEERFGTWARLYAAVCYLLTQLARMGTVMYLMALPMAVLLGWDIRLLILVTGLAVTIYSMVGGIVAVIVTDAIQTVVLIVGAVTCAVFIPLALPGGLNELREVAAAHGKFSLGSFGASLGESTFWVVLFYGIFINLQNFSVDQNYVQRYLVAKSEADARRSVWFGGLLYLPLSAVFFFIGTALFAYYGALPEALPATYRDAGKSDYVFPWFIVTVLPPGVSGLLVAAIFSAAMSTVSTSLNSSATIALNDFFQRFGRPEPGERANMRRLHAVTLGWGICGTGVALAMTQVRSVLDTWWLLSGIFSGGMLGLFLLGFWSRRAGSRAALAGVSAGVLLLLWMTLSPKWTGLPDAWRSPFHGYLTIVFGTSTIVLLGLLLTTVIPRGSTGGSRRNPGR